MPAKSQAQKRLFQAAAHGATFKMAEQLRQSMPHAKLEEFTHGPMKAKPVHVPKPKAVSHPHRNLGGYLHPKKGR